MTIRVDSELKDMASLEEEFQIAADYVQKLPRQGPYKLNKETKLLLYSLFKQSTTGQCNTPRPGFFKFTERPKWDAWSKLGSMSKEEAMESYVKEFKKLKAKFDEAAGQEGS
jgi:acyl-CoA-binding protein